MSLSRCECASVTVCDPETSGSEKPRLSVKEVESIAMRTTFLSLSILLVPALHLRRVS